MSSSEFIFFNNMKKELGIINYHLYEIIKIYENLIKNTENFETENYTEEEKEGKHILKNKFIEFTELYNYKMIETNNVKHNIDIMIQEYCDHTYIHDTVDSGLDNSKNIEYCTKCYKSKK
jgi:hypothetical protein